MWLDRGGDRLGGGGLGTGAGGQPDAGGAGGRLATVVAEPLEQGLVGVAVPSHPHLQFRMERRKLGQFSGWQALV
jgi:hypothetical protein